MAEPRRTVIRRPRRLRRWIIAATVGVLLGLLVVFFFSSIYNPFTAGVPDLVALVHPEADFVLSIPDFPDFLGGLRERPFVAALRENPDFDELLRMPEIRRTGLPAQVQAAWAELDRLQGSLPLGLELLGDVSGRRVVLAVDRPAPPDGQAGLNGRGPAPGEKGPWPYLCVFRPGSWLTLAAVNVMRSERLAAWLLEDRLADRGLRLEHFRDSVKLGLPDGQAVFITRIGDAVLLSNQGKRLSRVFNRIQTGGLPQRPASRLQELSPTGLSGAPDDLRLVAARQEADAVLDLTGKLRELWGPGTLNLAASMLPRMGGEDLLLGLNVGEGFSLEIRTASAPPRPGDLTPALRAALRPHLAGFLDRVGALMPEGAFGAVYLGADPGSLVRGVLGRNELFTQEDRELLDDWAHDVPDFGGLEGMVEAFTATLGPEVGLIYFKQPREPLPTRAQPGYLAAVPLQDPTRLKELLSMMQAHIRGSRGEGFVKDIIHSRVSEVDLYELQVVGVDDPAVTQPGLAVVPGFVLFSNFHPYLEKVPDAWRNQEQSFGRRPAIIQARSYAPTRFQVAGLLDMEALQPYLWQSVEGWAYGQTTPTMAEQVRMRSTFKDQGISEGLDPGSHKLRVYVDRQMELWKRRLAEVDRPEIQKRFESYFEALEGLFSSAGIFVERGPLESSLLLRLDARR